MPSDKCFIYKTELWSWGFVNETSVWGHKTSYWAITLYYQIVSFLTLDMGERIAGKQNRPSLIIEAPPPPTHTPNSPKIKFFTFWPIYENLVVNYVPLLYMSQLWWGLHLLTFWYPWILWKGAGPPKNGKKKCLIFWILSWKVFIRLLPYK